MNRFAEESRSQRAITSPIQMSSSDLGASLFRAADTVIIQPKTWKHILSWGRIFTTRRFLIGTILSLCGIIGALLALIVQLHLS